MVEESEMWRQRDLEQKRLRPEYSFLHDQRADMSNEFSTSRKRRAHMDEQDDLPKRNYWMKELYKAEENDSNRYEPLY